ncbi:MAG: hypothetical protein CL608_29035 [Anaerolineaceae bacterium]|nr:hypothetical protein [Anaerolineaceae bacterium]
MLRLSVEELAFAMGFLGGADVAASFLETILGQQNKDNLSGRVTAASHSLIARELLTLDLATGENNLEESFAQLVRAMMESGRSVRGQQLANGQETTLTCFVHDGVLAVHELELGVVSVLQKLPGKDALLQRLMDFVAPPEGTAVSPPVGQISTDSLQRVRQLAAQNKTDEVHAALADHLPDAIVEELAADLLNDAITWGSILSLVTSSGDADTPLESNEGILYTAVPPQKLWLFQLKADEPNQATLFRGSEAQLNAQLQQLLAFL